MPNGIGPSSNFIREMFNPERTRLSLDDEVKFQRWAVINGIRDVDHPDSHYDYRGYWKSTNGSPIDPNQHFPDTFKQHGHPTFSIESQYSRGPYDGGLWNDDVFIPQLNPVISHRR